MTSTPDPDLNVYLACPNLVVDLADLVLRGSLTGEFTLDGQRYTVTVSAEGIAATPVDSTPDESFDGCCDPHPDDSWAGGGATHSDFEFDVTETDDGWKCTATETVEAAIRRVHEVIAAQEDERIKRQLVTLGWTPPDQLAQQISQAEKRGAVKALRSAARDDQWDSWYRDGADVRAWLNVDAHLVETGQIDRLADTEPPSIEREGQG